MAAVVVLLVVVVVVVVAAVVIAVVVVLWVDLVVVVMVVVAVMTVVSHMSFVCLRLSITDGIYYVMLNQHHIWMEVVLPVLLSMKHTCFVSDYMNTNP